MKYIALILCFFWSFTAKAQTINDNELVRVSNYQSPVPASFACIQLLTDLPF